MPEENQPVVSNPTYNTPEPPKKKKLFTGQIIFITILILIVGAVIVWKPWDIIGRNPNDRTVSVTGTSEITAEPDEYVFTPEYDTKSPTKAAALAASTAKTNEIVAKLKSLGVEDSKIKTDTSSYSYYDDSQQTYYANLTVTVDGKELAQKVQDYLLTTTPTGSVSPQASFSKATKDKLTAKARNEAITDAKNKANQNANNIGFKVGKVKSVDDSPNGNLFMPYSSIAEGANSAAVASDTAPIQQGENSLTYQVKVVYFIH